MGLRRASWTCAAPAFLLWSQVASAQEICTVYTAAEGDTLASIAAAAGIAGGAQLLQSANADILGEEAALVAGTRLRIPCADGVLPPLDAAAAPAQDAADAAGAGTDGPPLRLLTGDNFAPFVGDGLPGGGMFVELVEAALEAADPGRAHATVSIFDWGSHLTTLLPTGAFDLGYPWHMPDCAQIDELSEANRIRCTGFDASDAFFEAVVAYYTLAGGRFASAARPEELRGARICRPSGWFTFDLEQAGLVEPAVTLVFGAIPTACWRELQAGRVDVVTYDALTADGDLARLRLGAQVVDLPGLQTLATMHVIAPRSAPDGRANLEILNRGLAELREDGRWFAIVARHLSAYNAAVEAAR